MLKDVSESIPLGWKSIFEKYLKELSSLSNTEPNAKVWILDAKEKYGQLRIAAAYEDCSNELCEKLYKLEQKYETLSKNVCQYCGEKGEATFVGGWTITLCEKCKQTV